ncbi:MAG: Abi family protein [Muribaculaceae bacterium]|nr:Abi family protein [Muribaculaceae bacterium]
MARLKIPYTKRAKTLDEQIATLRRHEVVILDEEKAKEYLSDIGYYRLGFYLHPFEITYPHLDGRRRHDVQPGTRIEDMVALYYFDFDLRNILNRYLSRIEVAVRTALLYELSNKYHHNPTWFVDPGVVTSNFITDFPTVAYNAIKKNDAIKRHHKKYIGQFAPAWKTMEYMTLGNLETLYDSLLLNKDKKLVSNRFGEPATATFKSYLSAIRELRNACAHGKAVFDLKLYNGIRSGKAGTFSAANRHTMQEALVVVDYMLNYISENRVKDMWYDIYAATARLYGKTPVIRPIIESSTGIILPKVGK